jgi:uncharacterized membrane protein
MHTYTLILMLNWALKSEINVIKYVIRQYTKETMKKGVETMVYLSSLLPTASTKVSATRGNVRKALLTRFGFTAEDSEVFGSTFMWGN